jgi:hypothetical protein
MTMARGVTVAPLMAALLLISVPLHSVLAQPACPANPSSGDFADKLFDHSRGLWLEFSDGNDFLRGQNLGHRTGAGGQGNRQHG